MFQNAKANRLKFAFNDAAVSLGFPAGATLMEVAFTLVALVPYHYDRPIVIDLTLAAL